MGLPPEKEAYFKEKQKRISEFAAKMFITLLSICLACYFILPSAKELAVVGVCFVFIITAIYIVLCGANLGREIAKANHKEFIESSEVSKIYLKNERKRININSIILFIVLTVIWLVCYKHFDYVRNLGQKGFWITYGIWVLYLIFSTLGITITSPEEMEAEIDQLQEEDEELLITPNQTDVFLMSIVKAILKLVGFLFLLMLIVIAILAIMMHLEITF